MKHAEELRRTRERLEARRGFFVHLAVFVLVNLGLVTVNLITAPGHLWAAWPLIGWGIGLAFHALSVFVLGERFAITDEMVERSSRTGPRS